MIERTTRAFVVMLVWAGSGGGVGFPVPVDNGSGGVDRVGFRYGFMVWFPCWCQER